MNEINKSPALERWRKSFDTDPESAITDLLGGRINLGPYNRARPADALLQLLLTEEDKDRAGKAILAWLKKVHGKPSPDGQGGKRFAESLVETFHAVERLPLPGVRKWLAERHGVLRGWLRGFYFGGSRDPEGAMLLALAHNQPDRSLQSLWLGLARLDSGVSFEYGLLGITGLRLMPANNEGAPEHNLPRALLRGLLDLGEALARKGNKKGGDWVRELDFLAMVYPMSKQTWGQRFREVLQNRDASPSVRFWLDKRYPIAVGKGPKTRPKEFLTPPSLDETQALLKQIS